ncbi:hypothetical protein M2459_002791 [Parabacteroides sp. PF5-5]|uniref:glycoside hydrolase family 172 protein n=1 Tax=unclassified Parabacteroides TaxID=2649774 RepID=UPI00247686A3|nr:MULTISPECIES: glycoside hydrolase family 172 protein [unclassified Parabacteroides]MDH6306065.1 hypothetical protein [Parabacteroides sp. PH5-39]MDH6317037.1 hypothetical protein [Parabacteroides sp. PF5-13]MDH6320790.1 hypothetical protein [Parabacteroides sp. PH5-13]MDH6324508.1 hypothetical protein [Parabacteroides sp. PH5-8]MDH6328222.1 hypothetical protein [Parabacteroides sp. PH5-41]
MRNRFLYITFIVLMTHGGLFAQEVFMKREGQTAWTSFENLSGEKGKSALENKGAKGHAFDRILAGDSCVLLNIKGAGIINRIWLTVNDRSPEMLRALKIKMYWDDAAIPAVSVPLGEFFCNGGATMVAFENCFFSNPEGKSMNTNIPMPFRKAARIVLINESDKNLSHIFYDVNLTRLKKWDDKMLYFHCYWNRENPTVLGKDYTVLPEIKGEGRFLGVSFGVNANTAYGGSWWGEGEMKFYLDGDKEHPSLCGTGVEDYVGTAWGLGAYSNWYQGCPISGKDWLWSFYRFHVPDPVLFTESCRVTLQQIGGGPYEQVLELYKANVPMIPVTVDHSDEWKFIKLLELKKTPAMDDPDYPKAWTNYYRQDDVSSTAYFYLDKPSR